MAHKGLQVRLRDMIAATPAAARIAAPLIDQRLIKDATTKRGNVPQFPPLGPLVKIGVKPNGSNITVRAPAWVLKKVNEKGQFAAWTRILKDAARAAMKGKR